MAETYQPPEGYLTTEGAAELLSVSLVTMRKIIREAGLEIFRDRRNRRVRLLKREDVEQTREPISDTKVAA